MVMVGHPVVEGVGGIRGFVNAYVFQDESGCYLIDATFSKTAKPIRAAFERAGVPIDTVGQLLLTHQHMDHVRGASELHRRATGAKISCHPADAPYIDGRIRAQVPFLLRPFVRVPPVPIDRTIGGGDTVGPLRVVHVPGHTAGELAFYHPARKLLFSGDAVCESKGRLVLPAPRAASDLAQAVASLRVLRELEVETLLPGHGLPVTRDVAGRIDELIARAPREYLGA